MKLFQNKFFLICLAVALVLSASATTLSLMGFNGLVRNTLGVVAAPFRWIGGLFVNAAEGFGHYFSSLEELSAANEALAEQNRELKERLERARLLEQENQRLRDYLSMKSSNPSLSFEEGMAIGREASNYATVITLNRGSIHGIEVDMAVITKDGVVGCVSEVGLTWCKVSTLLETARSVGVYLPGSNAAGILSGSAADAASGLCTVTFVDVDPKSADVKAGDTVLTSGIGSVYPAELRVGEIVEVRVDPASRELTATVRPFAGLRESEYFMIVTGYQR